MLRIHGNKFKHLAGLSYAGIAGSSAAFLLIIAAMLFAPAASQPEASATEDNSGISTYAATPTVGISLPTSFDFADVLPTPSGATTTATADLTITTTDSAGYSLYLYSSDGDNSLRPKISANTSSINATAGGVGLTLSSLKPNTWGYNLGTTTPDDTTTYSAVPTDNSTPIQTKDTSDTNSANDTYTLSFGAKVDMAAASGTYSNTLTIAVVAEPKKIPIGNQISYMQDMTSEICANAPLNDTTRLIDRRDGKYYWVAKLADGNCWMTQNLDLNLSSGQPLTPADSDVSSNYTPITTSVTPITGEDDYGQYSYDPGLYVKSSPADYDNKCHRVSSLSDTSCSSAGWINVSNWTPMTEVRTDGIVVTGNNYDAHYLIGNYYSWCAVTAGTCTNYNKRDSICPKGWTLPQTGQSGNSDYELLFKAFSPNSNSVTQYPLFFLPGGTVGSGIIGNAGAGGYYRPGNGSYHGYGKQAIIHFSPWSSPEVDAYDTYIGGEDGLTVRCFAKAQ